MLYLPWYVKTVQFLYLSVAGVMTGVGVKLGHEPGTGGKNSLLRKKNKKNRMSAMCGDGGRWREEEKAGERAIGGVSKRVKYTERER